MRLLLHPLQVQPGPRRRRDGAGRLPLRRESRLSEAVPPIAIVGAGIAGLASALALSRNGHAVALFERAETLEAVGAGIQLSPNALRALNRLGLRHRIEAFGSPARRVTLRRYDTGRPLATVPVEAADGTGYLSIHRADLQETLAEAVRAETRIDFRLGMGLAVARNGADRVSLAFADGSTQDFALAIGADGYRSRLAAALHLPGCRDTGLSAARFLAPASERPGHGIEAWLGPRRHAVAYPVRGGALRNVVLIAPRADDPADLLAGFRRWDPALVGPLGQADFRGTWPLHEAERGRRLVHGRVCLVGDAGHAMLPFAAQGAAMALEDAVVLAHAIGRDTRLSDLPARLEAFETARRERLARVHRRVAFHRFVYHLQGPLALARDLAMRSRSEASLRADLGWLYDWEPPR